MVIYERCSKVEADKIYEAFKEGFSDYIIKIEVPKAMFFHRFLGYEGNALEHSFIAIEDDKAIGLILGGIKNYEGIKTLRCGSFCVSPEYRGREVSVNLFNLHREEGIRNNCKQLFLETIVGNDKAIKFYTKNGYEKIYDLKYFSCNDFGKIKKYVVKDILIEAIDIKFFSKVWEKASQIHINWQNDFDYISKSENQNFFGAFIKDKIIGAICVSTSGKVSFLWVEKDNRCKGVGSSLLEYSVRRLEVKKLTNSMPNNSSLEGFLRHIGFNKDSIAQYEMYKFL
jgi:ribosomal protein S18 acetylase RimI-like enzyme